MQNAVNAAYFIGTTAPMYKINPSLSVFHTIPELVLAKSLFLKNVTTSSVACVAGVERGRGWGNLGAREGERKGSYSICFYGNGPSSATSTHNQGNVSNTPLLLSVWFFVLFSLCSSPLFFLLWLLAPVKQFKNINNCDP